MFSEMSLSAAAPEDVPPSYCVVVQVAELRQSVGRWGFGAAVWHHGGVLSQKKTAHIIVFSVEPKTPDAFCFKRPVEGASWPWGPFEYTVHATNNDAIVHK